MQVLPPGANQPLSGGSVTIEVTASGLGGICLVAEEGQRPTVLPPLSPATKIARTGSGATVTLELGLVGSDVARLRLLLWSESTTRTLAPVAGRVLVDGTPTFQMTIADPSLRSAELLEIYRRTGQWKVRTIASGWVEHVPAMATAVGLPEVAFRGPAAPAGAPSVAAPPPTTTRRPPRRTAHHGPSPAVGPPPLRTLLDSIVGPGPRSGTDLFVDFEVGGVPMRLSYENFDGPAQVVALVPLGRGTLTDATAEIALRVTGESPLARITIDEEGGAIASAMAVVPPASIDSGLLKALLSEAWVAGYRFARRAESIGWPISDAFTEQIPRELRLGVAEDLQDQEVWRELRDRLILNDLMPLADEPAALLALTEGQLWIGPSVLAGTPRAWAIIVERVLRSDVSPRAGTWRSVQAMSNPFAPVRVGLIEEVGASGPLAITASFSALQLPRTQVMDDLQYGLNFVDDRAEELEPQMRRLTPDAASHRNNLPWVPTRTWNGPGSELRDGVLVREISGIPEAGGVPRGLADRVRQQQGTLGRPGLAYLGHLALLRAERSDGAAPAWRQLAREILTLVPASGPGDPCAAGSLHVRMNRLEGAEQARRRPAPTAPAPPQPRPTPARAAAPAGAPTPPSPERKKRWRLFG